MKPHLVNGASRLLTLLPFAQALTRQAPSARLTAATAVLNTPWVRRVAPGLSAVATVGLAAVAVVSFVKGLKTAKAARGADELTRSSAT